MFPLEIIFTVNIEDCLKSTYLKTTKKGFFNEFLLLFGMTH